MCNTFSLWRLIGWVHFDNIGVVSVIKAKRAWEEEKERKRGRGREGQRVSKRRRKRERKSTEWERGRKEREKGIERERWAHVLIIISCTESSLGESTNPMIWWANDCPAYVCVRCKLQSDSVLKLKSTVTVWAIKEKMMILNGSQM